MSAYCGGNSETVLHAYVHADRKEDGGHQAYDKQMSTLSDIVNKDGKLYYGKGHIVQRYYKGSITLQRFPCF